MNKGEDINMNGKDQAKIQSVPNFNKGVPLKSYASAMEEA